MRFLHIAPVYPPYPSGMGHAARAAAEGLVKLGHQVTVVTLALSNESKPGSSVENGVEIHRLAAWPRYGLAGWPKDLWSILHQSWDGVLLHAPFFGAQEMVLLAKILGWCPKKLVIYYHMDVVSHGWVAFVAWLSRVFVIPLLVRAADTVMASSKSYAETSWLADHWHTTLKKLVINPFGVDTNKFTPPTLHPSLPHSPKTILFVGGLDRPHYFKGLSVLLQAMSIIKHRSDWQLEIIGDGDLRAEYERQSQHLGLTDRVKFLGRQADGLTAAYARAYLHVLPSLDRSEAFGLVVLEAQSSGVPSIVSDLPGVREAIDPNQTGLLVEPGNIIKLQEAIVRLLDDASLHSQMSAASRARVITSYTWDAHCHKIESAMTSPIETSQLTTGGVRSANERLATSHLINYSSRGAQSEESRAHATRGERENEHGADKSEGRILIIHDRFQFRGGAERLVLDLAKMLDADICTEFWCEGETFDRTEVPHSLYVLDQGEPKMMVWRYFRAQWNFWWKTRRLIKQYDTIIFSGNNCLAAALRPLKNQRTILYCHTPVRYVYDLLKRRRSEEPALWKKIIYYDIGKYGIRFLYQLGLGRIQTVIANSKNVQDRLWNFCHTPAKVIYPPIDVQKYRWQGQGDYYLSWARLDSLKRVEDIVRAFQQLPDQKLIVASSGDRESAVRALAANYPNIQVLGWTSNEKLAELVGNCIATIYIPIDEDFGMSPVESMSAGKPCIGVNDGGVRETVIPNKTGLLVPKEPTIADIVAAVKELNPERALAMRTECENWAQQFSSARFEREIREIL